MATITFNITTTNQMKDFIFFQHKSGLMIYTQENDEFYELLYKSIQEKKVYPGWLHRKYLDILKDKYNTNVDDTHILQDINEKPTEKFASICGRENLTKDGLISKRWAYNFIMNQIKLRGTHVVDDIIYVDDFLQSLFNIHSVKIDRYELTDLIDTLFNTTLIDST